MEKSFLKLPNMLCSHFFILLILLLMGKSVASFPEINLKDELGLIHQEIGALKNENHNQNIEINLLKNAVGIQDNNKKSPAINKGIGNDQIKNELPSERDHHLNKRPYRLLPPNTSVSNKNQKFYGPPTNCSELSQLGYTLNGYYQVKSTKFPDINQVETVYCSFKQPEWSINQSIIIEKRVLSSPSHFQFGKMAGSGVHFYAFLQSLSGHSQNTVIQFNDVKVNLGNGFDSKSGLFTASKSGVYQFFFKAKILESKPDLFYIIALYRNRNERVGVVNKYPNDPFRDSLIQAVLELKRGDTVRVESTSNQPSFLSSLTLSGSLLEELP